MKTPKKQEKKVVRNKYSHLVTFLLANNDKWMKKFETIDKTFSVTEWNNFINHTKLPPFSWTVLNILTLKI